MQIRSPKLLISAAIVMLMITGCSSNPREVDRAVYFWKSNQYNLTQKEDTILQKMHQLNRYYSELERRYPQYADQLISGCELFRELFEKR